MKLVSDKFFTNSLVVFLIVFSVNSIAADNSSLSNKVWKNINHQSQGTNQLAAKLTSSLTVRTLELDEIGFKLLLNKNITSDDNFLANRSSNTSNNVARVIALPLPDGNEVNVAITPSSAMSPALALQFPDIKTWTVSGVSDEITGSIDFTHRGFHGMLMMPDGDRVFIEPEAENATSNQSQLNSVQLSTQSRYISFSEKQNLDSFNNEFSCGVDDASKLHFNTAAKSSPISARLQAKAAPDLITYRLAVATTGEYAQFHGGTTASTLSAIVTTINRVNQIYMRDLGVRFELVAQQSDIIYLNPDTDPYTNSSVFSLIQENDINLSSNGMLSETEYDVGHVFGAGNVGGLASVGGVCNDDAKAIGATGIFRPIGDAFALDFVAHELGHQLGGTHTFNSACGDGSERTAETAVETGSGTTIMAYPGICQENNLQTSVDPQFHVVSIDQIRTVTRTGGGSSCGVPSMTGNENPTVTAGDDVTVPARTPLVLIAVGADADNDALTYSWEQSDTGDVSDFNIDLGNNAIFRSRPLSFASTRFIPTLSDLFSGTPTDGELLPVSNRDINMVATIRDGNGGLQADLIKLRVFDSGDSFRITSNTNNQSFGRQDIADIRWNVAGTNLPPVSCTNVDIGLLTSNGNGINIATTENDGRQSITIPDSTPAMNDARIIVSCSDNNFFNVSSGRITILDQVGGGSIGASRSIASNIFSASNGGGGGGSFGIFILLWASLLICIRESRLMIR